LGGSSAEGFEANKAFIYKYLDVFSRNSGSTITTKLLIYSTKTVQNPGVSEGQAVDKKPV